MATSTALAALFGSAAERNQIEHATIPIKRAEAATSGRTLTRADVKWPGLLAILLVAVASVAAPGVAATDVQSADSVEARLHSPKSRAHRTGTGATFDADGIPVAITFRPWMGATRAFLEVGRGEHPCPHLSDPELVMPLSGGRTLSVRFSQRGTWLISRTAVSRLPLGSSFLFTRCDRRERVSLP